MININIKTILSSIESLLLGSIVSDLPAVKDVISKYIAEAATRLPLIAEGAVSGKLSYKEVIGYLKDEEVNLKDELISVVLIIGSDVQAIINDAINIFENALKAAIPAN